jgi:hypothetical protein
MPSQFVAGRNLHDIGRLYKANRVLQSGRNIHYVSGKGLGSVFKGALSFLQPYISSGLKTISREALAGGLNVLDNLNDDNSNIKSLVKTELKQRGLNLRDKAMRKIRGKVEGSNIRMRRRRQGIKRLSQNMNSLIHKVVVKPRTKRRKKAQKVKKNKKASTRKRRAASSIFD